MQYQFVRLNLNIFLGSVILGFILGFISTFYLMKGSEAFEYIILLFLVVIIITILGYHAAKRPYILDLSQNEYLVFEEKTIYYKDILGYFKFDEALLGGAFGLLDSNLNRINLSTTFSGNKKGLFLEAQEKIIEKLMIQNPAARELKYAEYHQKQMGYLRPFLYVLIAIVLLAAFGF